MSITTCPTCEQRTCRAHTTPADCIAALRARVEDREPVFGMHDRRLRLLLHPDADAGQYVLVAGFGQGDTTWTNAYHEIAMCLDEPMRQQLIAILQSEPEHTS